MTRSIANMSVKTLPFKTIKHRSISLTPAHKFTTCTNLKNMNGTNNGFVFDLACEYSPPIQLLIFNHVFLVYKSTFTEWHPPTSLLQQNMPILVMVWVYLTWLVGFLNRHWSLLKLLLCLSNTQAYLWQSTMSCVHNLTVAMPQTRLTHVNFSFFKKVSWATTWSTFNQLHMADVLKMCVC
jgi:hypothetical protein